MNQIRNKKGQLQKGSMAWNKGLINSEKIKKCEYCEKEFIGQKITTKYCSKSCFNKAFFTNRDGKRNSIETRKKISDAQKGTKNHNFGKKASIETKQKMSNALVGIFAKDKNPMWKGGISKENSLIRASLKYKKWKLQVFYRDLFICQCCNSRKRMEAHHIKSFADYPELRFNVNNGVTLCNSCHMLLHKIFKKIRETKCQILLD